jgi:L-rhamnose mutarotase
VTRHVLMADLRDDPAAIDAYRAHHRQVWPEVIESLRRAGIREMEIYLLGRHLVMIVDTDRQDVRRCFDAHAASSPAVVEWEALMRRLQQPPAGAAPGEWWAIMEPLFRLEPQEDAAGAARVVRR